MDPYFPFHIDIRLNIAYSHMAVRSNTRLDAVADWLIGVLASIPLAPLTPGTDRRPARHFSDDVSRSRKRARAAIRTRVNGRHTTRPGAAVHGSIASRHRRVFDPHVHCKRRLAREPAPRPMGTRRHQRKSLDRSAPLSPPPRPETHTRIHCTPPDRLLHHARQTTPLCTPVVAHAKIGPRCSVCI